MRERRREMARLRAQQSYMASKARRQKKIKSKKWVLGFEETYFPLVPDYDLLNIFLSVLKQSWRKCFLRWDTQCGRILPTLSNRDVALWSHYYYSDLGYHADITVLVVVWSTSLEFQCTPERHLSSLVIYLMVICLLHWSESSVIVDGALLGCDGTSTCRCVWTFQSNILPSYSAGL